jgi:hypothetical protein
VYGRGNKREKDMTDFVSAATYAADTSDGGIQRFCNLSPRNSAWVWAPSEDSGGFISLVTECFDDDGPGSHDYWSHCFTADEATRLAMDLLCAAAAARERDWTQEQTVARERARRLDDVGT